MDRLKKLWWFGWCGVAAISVGSCVELWRVNQCWDELLSKTCYIPDVSGDGEILSHPDGDDDEPPILAKELYD